MTNKPACPAMTTAAGAHIAEFQDVSTARPRGARLCKTAWRVLGTISVAIGVINAFLPLLPTTVFLLIGAWAYGKGAPEWRERLLAHPRFGPPLRHWENGQRMTRRAKRAALSGMAFGFAFTWAALGNVLPVAVVGTGLLLLAAYLAQRPEPATEWRRPEDGLDKKHDLRKDKQ